MYITPLDEEDVQPVLLSQVAGFGVPIRGRFWVPVNNENIKKNGERVWFSWTNKAIRNEKGEVIGTLTVGNDITELKRSEEKLASLNEELDGYAHAVSHDLRSPLGAINLANACLREKLAMIESERLKQEVAESVDTIGRSITKTYELVNGLLALARAGNVPEEVESVEAADVIVEVLEGRAGMIEERGIGIDVQGSPGTILANRLHVYQVFDNIIGNALAHNDSMEPSVIVRSLGTDTRGSHGFEIIDNGSGIPLEDLQFIFRPFYKRGRGAGSGIGLPIAKKIVELYGGDIRAFNREGACFAFSLRDWQQPEPDGRRTNNTSLQL